MRYVFITLIVAGMLGSCSAGKQSKASSIGLVPLENYFVPINNPLDTGMNYKVITGQSEFEKTFTTADPSNGAVRKPDFNGQTVVAVIHKTGPNQRKEIVMDGANFTGTQMSVFYHIKETLSSPVTTYLPGLALATVPKVLNVKRVSFFEDSVLVKTVPVNIY